MTTPSQLRQTHTVVVLGISQAAFDEISAKLRAAGYDHVFMPDGEIDMSGIAVAVDASAGGSDEALRIAGATGPLGDPEVSGDGAPGATDAEPLVNPELCKLLRETADRIEPSRITALAETRQAARLMRDAAVVLETLNAHAAIPERFKGGFAKASMTASEAYAAFGHLGGAEAPAPLWQAINEWFDACIALAKRRASGELMNADYIDAATAAEQRINSIARGVAASPIDHVGESNFEGWFASYDPAGKGDKQRARDAYAAGLGEQAEHLAGAEEVPNGR